MTCNKCKQEIDPKQSYSSSTKIGYKPIGRKGSKTIKTQQVFYHKSCKDTYKLTKEQLLDNWENGYCRDRAED